MSLYDKFCPSQIKRQQSPQKESQQLKQSLMQRAKQLKQKMYQQTNVFDYSINHLMTQTLKQIKKHKEQFREKQELLIQEQQNEQTKRKKSLLNNQLMQNIQKCKNKYKKHITTIKNQRKRLYTDSKEQSPRQNVEDMLITAKNKFKKEEKQKRNHSEIFNSGSGPKNSAIHTHNRTHNMITAKKTPKLYQKLVKVNEDLTYILEDPLSFPHLTEEQMREVNRQKLQQREIYGLITPKASKKQAFESSTNPNKKVYYSPYSRFPTQLREKKNTSKIQTFISERSLFVPLGKIIRCQRKQLEINNYTKRDQNIDANEMNIKALEISKRIVETQIIVEAQERQPNKSYKKTLERQEQGSLPSNRLLSKEKAKSKSISKKPETKRSNFLTQTSILQSQNMTRLNKNISKKSQLMFDDIRGTRIITQFTPTFKESPTKQFPQNFEQQQRKQIKMDEDIKGKISLCDSKFMLDSIRRDSLLTRPLLFHNSKFKGLSKGTVKDVMRYQAEGLRQSQLVVVMDYKKKLSKSINLDVRGNNVKLMQSFKLEKTHKTKGSDFSQTSIHL